MTENRPGIRAGITLRTVCEDDMEFIYQVYAASRDQEMAQVANWSAAEREAFLRDQFRLQHHHYQTHYGAADYQLILKAGQAIGRLYVAPMSHEIRLMDIALLPEHRGQGIGGQLVQELMEEGRRSDRFVSLHVEETNPARRLYERMGFVVVGDVSFYKLMHWIPAGLSPVYADGAPGSGNNLQEKTAS